MNSKLETRMGLIGIIVITALIALISSGCGGIEGKGTHRNMGAPQHMIRVPENFSSITAALNAARYGDIVEVGGFSGVYSESDTGEIFPLYMKPGVTLRKGQVRSVTINMDGQNNVPILEMESETSVEGFGFISTSRAATVTNVIVSYGASRVTIKNNEFYVHSGVLIVAGKNFAVEGNTFYPWSSRTLMLAPREALAIQGSQDVLVKNNTFSSFQKDISIERSISVRLERNIVVAGGVGVEIDDTSLSNTNFVENDVWANVEYYFNSTTQAVFLPTSGNNISADPRFLNRESGDFRLSESSPCILPGGEVIGARGAPIINAKPTITKSAQNTAVMQTGIAGVRVLAIELKDTGTDPVFFHPYGVIYTRLNSSVVLPPYTILRMRDASGIAVAEGTVPNAGGTVNLLSNGSFPRTLNPGETKEFWFEVETTAAFNTGATLQLDVISMEWMYGPGYKVDDGFTPQGLPVANTVVKP